jgi:hypothetical protein
MTAIWRNCADQVKTNWFKHATSGGKYLSNLFSVREVRSKKIRDMKRQDPRWGVTVIQDEAVGYQPQAPVTGMMLSLDSDGQARYQSYEYRSDRFTLDPQYSQRTETAAVQRSGSFFESSITKNWFSLPQDLDAYCSKSSSPTPVSNLFDSMSKREPEPELMLAYQRAVSSIEKYQKALSKYVTKLESGGVDALILDSERADLLLLYRDADITVNEYRGMYNVNIQLPTHANRVNGSSPAKSASNSSQAIIPRTRARMVFHM